jgi:hypothetical protein
MSSITIPQLPPLETKCPSCHEGKMSLPDGREIECYKCGGTAKIPTEAGKQILELIVHNGGRC